MVAGALVARVVRAGYVISVEFWVADAVEDIEGESAEANNTLFLDFEVRASFKSPLHEKLTYGASVSVALVSSSLAHGDWAEPEVSYSRDG